MIKLWSDGENELQYEKQEHGIRLLQWRGRGSCARIPDEIEEMPVKIIGRKAFLSNKQIQELYLPESICRIEDWAFAYCSRLRLAVLPKRELSLGKAVFLKCSALEQLRLYESQKEEKPELLKRQRDTGWLLAAVVDKLDAPQLLNPAEAGRADWIQKWDERLSQVLNTPDREGYGKTILGGEEDYGSMENNLEDFLSQKRRNKVRLALLRLLHDMELSDKLRQQLKLYLCRYTKGCEAEESWLVVKEEYADRREYYDLLAEAGALTEQNFDAILTDLGTEMTEIKAYLLKKKEEWFDRGSFFDSLTL